MKKKQETMIFLLKEDLTKLLKIMNFIGIILIAATIQVSATAFSQSTKLSMNLKNASITEVMDVIESQSNFKFLYHDDLIKNSGAVSANFRNKSIQDILATVFKDSGNDYQVLANNLVVITPIDGFSNQELTVKGKVIDVDGNALPGVNIIEKGTNNGSVTNLDGEYTLELTTAEATLVFSYVGFLKEEVEVAGQTTIDITLIEDVQNLEEVVVVGYASQKKANLAGSVTSVEGEKIESIPAADVTNAISGRLPGSVIIQETGEPGQNSARILVRGRSTLGDGTSPLIVIDGIPDRELSEIDPVDIASISVLKDAAAAIYGAQAANGVILVTTKRGQTGAPRLNYQFYQGFMQPTIIPKVANAGDYATMLREYQLYENREPTYSEEDIALYYSGEDPWEHPNSDWYDDLIADWTTTSKHNITLDGGHNGMYYYISAGMKGEEGIYEQASTRYKQYNLRAKVEMPVTDWLKASLDLAGFQTERRYPAKSAYTIVGQSTRLVPTQWSFWPNGKPGPDIEYGDNPVVTSTLETGTDDQKFYKLQSTFRLTVTPKAIEGLTLDGYYSYDIDNEYHKRFVKPWILYYPNWESATRDPSTGYITDMDLIPTPRGYSSPEMNEWYSRPLRKLANLNFNYAKDFGDHHINLFGAYEQFETEWNYFGSFRKYYISDKVQTMNAGSDTDKDNFGEVSIYARKSLIGRFNYNYKEKYLLELILRRDGSLKFPEDNRWGNFPGVLLAWRLSEEDFWKQSLGFINYFKLRGSYGLIGMDPGDAFQFMNKYVLTKGMTMGTGKVVETTVIQDGVANPDITWEKQKTMNVGFDAQFFDNTFYLNTEIFKNNRYDILAPRDASVPGYTGLALPDENIAEVQNHGFELEGGYNKEFGSGLQVNISANISWNHNEVVFMDEPERAVPWQQRTGHPYGAVLMYDAIGVFADQAAVDAYPHWSGAKPGDVIFADTDGNGEINSDDQILYDKTDFPETFYGINLDVSYRNFNLSLLVQGQGEYFVRNNQDGRRGEAGNYFQWFVDDRWTPNNIHTDVARAYNRDDQYWSMDSHNSTYWYDNMAYARLKNAVLTYNLPKKLLEDIPGVTRASVYFSGNNLFLLYAAQKNFDPEVHNPMQYPAMRTLAVGARVTF